MVKIPSIPFLPECQKAHALTILSEIRSGVSPSQISKLTFANQILLNVAGSWATGQDFLFSQRLRDLMMRHLAYLWQEEYPGMIIVTPTTPGAGWRIAEKSDAKRGGWGVSDGDSSLRSMEYVYLANFTGCPAITAPMGYVRTNGGSKVDQGRAGEAVRDGREQEEVEDDGADPAADYIPVGIMGMGEWGSEEHLIQWARDGEEMLGLDHDVVRRPRRPDGWVDVLGLAMK